MRKNSAFVAQNVITHLTKKFIAIFALAERLPTSATLDGHNHGKGEVDGDSHSNGDGKSNIDYDDDMMLEALLTKLFQESGALASAVVGGGGVRGRSSTWSSKDLTWSSKEEMIRSDTAIKDVMFSNQSKTKLHFKIFVCFFFFISICESCEKNNSDQLTTRALNVLIRGNFPPGLRQKLESISAACAVQPIPKRILESKENSNFFFAVDQIDHTHSGKARPGNGRLS